MGIGLLAACASQHRQLAHFPDQKVAIENPQMGRIYVLRHPWSFNIASHVALVTIWDGEEEIGSIAGHRGFLCWERPVGDAVIRLTGSDFPECSLVVSIEKGRTYYVIQGLVPLRPDPLRLTLVDEETGLAELKQCHPPKLETVGVSRIDSPDPSAH